MPARPVITLTTDFGLTDSYVAEIKAVLLKVCPETTIVDVTHQIPPQDITAGSLMIERAVTAFGPGAIHIAVVDPGVGTHRPVLAVNIGQATVICPDNGLITWTWRVIGGGTARRLPDAPATASPTFHGRDVMAPFAAKLATGESFDLHRVEPVLLDLRPADPPTVGRVIHVDHFGNATTNILANSIPAGARCTAGERDLGPVRRTYADVPVGAPLALIGSRGLLEIAVRNASAVNLLGIRVGTSVAVIG